MPLSRRYQTGTHPYSGQESSQCKHGGESRRQSHTAVLSQLDEQDEEEMVPTPESRPTSSNSNDSEEDIFLNQESSDEAAELDHPYQPSAECFETSRATRRRTDNHFGHQNNMTPTPTNARDDDGRGAAIKQRGKDTRTKNNTTAVHPLHRGKATTDFVRQEESSNSAGVSRKPKNTPNNRTLPTPRERGGGRGQIPRSGGGPLTSKQQKEEKSLKNQRLLKKPVISKPASPDPPNLTRPFTFCYEESTSQSSFENSFD